MAAQYLAIERLPDSFQQNIVIGVRNYPPVPFFCVAARRAIVNQADFDKDLAGIRCADYTDVDFVMHCYPEYEYHPARLEIL